jgi:hypothetical protein
MMKVLKLNCFFLRKNEHSEDSGLHERIILKRILGK